MVEQVSAIRGVADPAASKYLTQLKKKLDDLETNALKLSDFASGTFERTGASQKLRIADSLVAAGSAVVTGSRRLSTLGQKISIPDPGSLLGLEASGVLDLATSGWTATNIFTSTDEDTVAWTSGTFKASNGLTYAINAGNTGDMAATTYIFIDINVATDAYQTTTVALDAVGAGRVLIAVAIPQGSSLALLQVFGGPGGLVVDIANQISGVLTEAFAAAGLINANVTINADGSLSGAGGGQASLNSLPGTINLGSQVAGTLTTAFAAAGLINANVTINADGTLSGGGGGQASLNSLPGDIATTQIETDAITTPKIAALAVTASEIAANTITAAQIAALTITAAQIAAATITGAKIQAGTITGSLIAGTTITAANIAALTITAANIAASTITGSKIAGNTITAAQIAAATITVNEMAANSIGANQIQAGVIDAGKLTATLTFTQALVLSTGGYLRSGQTAYDTGTGFFLEYNGGNPRMSFGNPAGNRILIDTGAGTIQIIGDITANYSASDWGQFQTFAPSWNSGFSPNPSGTISYAISTDGRWAKLVWAANQLGTANAGGFSFSNLPSAIRPAGVGATKVVAVGLFQNGAGSINEVLGGAWIWQASHGSAGTFEFARCVSQGASSGDPVILSRVLWASSGSKGILAGTQIMWPL